MFYKARLEIDTVINSPVRSLHEGTADDGQTVKENPNSSILCPTAGRDVKYMVGDLRYDEVELLGYSMVK